jgi:hypothetical protein
MSKHESLTLPKIEEAIEPLIQQESQAVTEEFIEPFKTIVQSRLKLRETETELRHLIVELSDKLSLLTDLKKENVMLERDVLNKIQAKL